MKLLRISALIFLAVSLTGLARGQSGFYGAPDPLRVPQTQPMQQQAVAPYSNSSAPYAAPVGNAPGGYAPQVGPYTAPSGYAAPQTQYPAPSGYMPQTAPYQPAGNPSSAPVYRTAAAPRNTYIAQQPAQQVLTAPATPQPMPEPMPMYNEPAPQQNGSFNNQMPSEQIPPGPASSDGYVPYNSPCGPNHSTADKCEESTCGVDLPCARSCLWYGLLTGLALTRNDPNKVWVSSEPDPNLFLEVMNTTDPDTGWKFGGEIRFGRRFCGCCDPCNECGNTGYWAVEADYWTTDPFTGYSNFINPDGSSFGTPLNVRWISFNITGGFATGDYWFNDSYEQRLWRRDEIHSAEINLVHGQWANIYGSNWDFAFSIGPRFFRFYEDLRYGALKNITYAPNTTPVWGQNNGEDEAYLRDQITNSFWGGQIGVDLGYNVCSSLRFFITPKVGIYDNYVTSDFQAYLGNGSVAYLNYPGQTGSYPVHATKNAFAMLTQVDAGVEWFFAQRWSARIGYRVLAVSGIGLADAQFPPYINDIQDSIMDVNTNGNLILHGAFATLTFNF